MKCPFCGLHLFYRRAYIVVQYVTQNKDPFDAHYNSYTKTLTVNAHCLWSVTGVNGRQVLLEPRGVEEEEEAQRRVREGRYVQSVVLEPAVSCVLCWTLLAVSVWVDGMGLVNFDQKALALHCTCGRP